MSHAQKTASRFRSKLTTERQRRLLGAIRAGNYLSVAARYAGIAPSTLYRWLREGRRERNGPYRAVAKAVDRALARAEVRAVAILREGMQKDWKGALAYLARRYPRRWGTSRNHETERPPPEPIERPDGADEPARLGQIARILAEIGAIPPGPAAIPPAADESLPAAPADGEAGGVPPLGPA